jgi:hypothetical protein
MGVPLVSVLYQDAPAGIVGVLTTPLLLYHVEQLILGNIELHILKAWVERGEKKHEKEKLIPAVDEEQDIGLHDIDESESLTSEELAANLSPPPTSANAPAHH